jgi:hypothetical protein
MSTAKYREVLVTRSRKPCPGGYISIENLVLQNKVLSFRARGLLAYILSKPPHWRHAAEDLSHAAPDNCEGVHAIRTTLRELEAAGHATLHKRRDKNGRVTHKWFFRESPSNDNQHTVPSTDKPHTAPSPYLPEGGKPSLGEPVGYDNTVSDITVAAATAAAATTDGAIAIEPLPQPCSGGISASPGACAAPAALIPDQTWLPDMLTLLDLRRVQLNTQSTAKLELWQIADIYAAFVARKRDYPDDIKKARKDRPSLSPWKWFSEQLTSQKARQWGYMVAWWGAVANLDAVRADRNIAQQTNATAPDSDWPNRMREGYTGEQIEEWAVVYEEDFAKLPGGGKDWMALPAWMRALLNNNYRAGVVPEPGQPHAPASVARTHPANRGRGVAPH